jgi:hypothetical protein
MSKDIKTTNIIARMQNARLYAVIQRNSNVLDME